MNCEKECEKDYITGRDAGARLLMLVGIPASKSKKDWMMQIIYEAPPQCKQVVGSSQGILVRVHHVFGRR